MTALAQGVPLRNGQSAPLAEVPIVSLAVYRDHLRHELEHRNAVLSALFGVPGAAQSLRLYAAVSDGRLGSIQVLGTDVGDCYPALTPDIPSAHWFERELAEQWGIVPEGHPWLKPIRFHRSYRDGHDAWDRAVADPMLPGVQPHGTDYFQVRGDEIHEVAVGPVHAGVIEPGHFRFQCHGEQVFTLEIELGYQHRGIEQHLVGGPDRRTLHYMETLAGDTSIGHATAYCQALEGLSGAEVPWRGQLIRAVSLELERLANHTGDLGALAGDVGYLPTLSYCGRIRGDFLNATGSPLRQSLWPRHDPSGWRWLRSGCSPDRAIATEITGSASRRIGCSRIALEFVIRHGAVRRNRRTAIGHGPYAGNRGAGGQGIRPRPRRAAEIFPPDISDSRSCRYRPGIRATPLPVPSSDTWKSNAPANFSARAGRNYPRHGPSPAAPLRGDSIVVTLVEGWRGEICHVALTNAEGNFAHYKVVDPSFHNWIGLAMSLRDQQISDFPLCNKSFQPELLRTRFMSAANRRPDARRTAALTPPRTAEPPCCVSFKRD